MDIPIYARNGDQHDLIKILSPFLPQSLPVVRRLQFMSIPGGQTSHSRLLASFEKENTETPFFVAYVDTSKRPETEMWLFSSLELSQHTLEQDRLAEQQVIALFSKVRDLENHFPQRLQYPGTILVGSLHEKIFHLLGKNSLVAWASNPYMKFIFSESYLPSGTSVLLPPGKFSWGTIRPEDISLVLSRTDIPRQERTMLLLPSVAVFHEKNPSPIAWAFLGPDGSLMSLFCEKPYRRIGLAKALVARLFRNECPKFSSDNLAHSDVTLDNINSQGVSTSLGGQKGWINYWVTVRTTR